MRGVAAFSMAKKTTWIVQKQCAGQVQYFPIEDLFEAKQILHNILKFLMHGHVKDFSQN